MKPLLNLFMMFMISTFIYGDPCTEYKPIPDIHRRDEQYELSDGEDPINDREAIFEDWYGDPTFRLLDKAPGFFKCGGLYPMWMSDSDGQTATICVQDRSAECSETFRIEMKNCTRFVVYFLSVAPIHRASYCFVKDAGEPPLFDAIPSIGVDLENEEFQSKLLFRCNFIRSPENLFYETWWFIDGALVQPFDPAQWSDDYISNTTLTEDFLLDKGFKAGINVQCAVRAQFIRDGASSERRLSENKFVGVKVGKWDDYTLTEGEERHLHVELTVPFGCGTFYQRRQLICKFEIELITLPNPDDCAPALVSHKDCRVTPIVASRWQEPTNVTILAKVTSPYGSSMSTTHLKLTTPKKSRELSEFWKNYDLGYVAIQIKKNTSTIMYQQCTITSDPYLHTFDFRNWLDVSVGVYVLYKDVSKNIEVQIESETCSPEIGPGFHPKCTCGIAVRAGRTVFEISHCDTPVWYIGYTACEDGGDVMIVRRHWDIYQITLPTGTVIDVKVFTKDTQYLDVFVYPTPSDEDNSRGLCGVLSGNNNSEQSNSDDEEIVEPWRIAKDKSLFNPNVTKNELSSFQPMYKYCTCDVSTGDKIITCSPMAASEECVEPPNMVTIAPKKCTIAKRKKRMVGSKLRRYKRTTTEHSWRNGWNESSATAHCESKFNESASVQLVKDVPGVDVNIPLRDCVADIKASGTTLFTVGAISRVGIKARREALVNPALSEPDPNNPSAPTLYDVITTQVCPGDCSGKGTCSDGKCLCNSGHEGRDCSVDVTTPPQLFHAADDGHCDLADEDCLQTEVLGDVFTGGKGSKCSVKKQMVRPSGEKVALKETSSASMFESISEVFCTIPEMSEDEVVVSINISVSHAGDIYSNELSVLVYDSSCVYVDHSTGTWTLQTGYCVFKGRCAPEGSVRRDNPCIKCIEDGPALSWQHVTENGCADGNLHIGESTGSCLSKAPIFLTSILVLCHFLQKMF